MNKCTHEEHLSQPLQTNNKQFKIVVTFLTGYKGFFNVTNPKNKFHFMKSITDEDGFFQTTIPQGAYEIEVLNNEIKRITTDEGHYTGIKYPFTIKPNFSTLRSIIEISPQGPIFSLMFDDSMTDLLGFNTRTLCEKYSLSPNPDKISSFDIFFLECDIAQVTIFKGKRSGIIHNFTMNVDPG